MLKLTAFFFFAQFVFFFLHFDINKRVCVSFGMWLKLFVFKGFPLEYNKEVS